MNIFSLFAVATGIIFACFTIMMNAILFGNGQFSILRLKVKFSQNKLFKIFDVKRKIILNTNNKKL